MTIQFNRPKGTSQKDYTQALKQEAERRYMGMLEHVSTTWFRWLIPTVMATTKWENPDASEEKLAEEFWQGLTDSIDGFLHMHNEMADEAYDTALMVLNCFESNNLFGLLTQYGMKREFKAHYEEYLTLALASRMKEDPETFGFLKRHMAKDAVTA